MGDMKELRALCVVDFAYNLRDQVEIVPLAAKGTILGCYYGENGQQFQVRYFYDGSVRTEYFYSSELKPIPEKRATEPAVPGQRSYDDISALRLEVVADDRGLAVRVMPLAESTDAERPVEEWISDAIQCSGRNNLSLSDLFRGLRLVPVALPRATALAGDH
jgi:hypothetical protein